MPKHGRDDRSVDLSYEEEEEEEASEEEEEEEHKLRKQMRGEQVQAYTVLGPNRFELFETFDGHTRARRWLEERRSASGDSLSVVGLKSAIEKGTVYHGYRWTTLDRSKPKTTVQQLQPTAEAEGTRRPSAVAMLDLGRTKIERVFATQKEAREFLGLKSAGSIGNAIKKGTPARGYLFQKWDDVPEPLRTAHDADVPVAEVKQSTDRGVENVGADGTVLKTYPTTAAVEIDLEVSRRTVKAWIDENRVASDGSTWRWKA